MNRLLRVLLVEDSDDDAQLSLLELARCGYTVHHTRVQDAVSMERALREDSWDLVLCDYSMPGFAAPEAISIARESGLDLPFIIISGTIGEETAVDALKQGAHDFLVKGRLARLAPAIERELREVRVRRERRESEQRLRASEERFRTLVESLDDSVFILDLMNRVEGVFGNWVARAGITAERMIGRDAAELFGPELGAVHLAANARAQRGERVSYEWTMTEDRETLHFQTVLSQRLDGVGRVAGTVAVTRDVTEQKQVQEKLLFSDRMASVGMLAAGITHEINNPLAAVMGNLALAVQDVDAVIAKQGSSPDLTNLREEIEDSVEAAERIQQIVRDVKSFSHADASHVAPVDIHKVLESSVRLGRIELRHRAQIVRDYGAVPMVDGNESRLGQVFLNLIVNAAQSLKPGARGGDEIRIATRVGEDGRVVVEVHDKGVGIPPEQLGRLFTTLFTTKPPGVGTGLGLFICNQIVTGLGGDISATSTIGEGTTFRVHLEPAAASPVVSATEKSRSQLPAGRRASVLVVDADESVCDVLRRILSVDCDVVTTTAGRDALQWIGEGKRYDLILLDLTLTDVTGPDLHAELVKAAPEQARRVIFMTGGVFDAETRKFLEQVATPRLEKPFDASSVRALIAKLR